ncbi:MAG TPA: transposase [Abditibacteriaceae bacterium]|jgi:REP element-mobilizing transposase RayT
MAFDREKHHRRSVRLAGHNYADAGWYFLTICAAKRGEVFARIVDNTVQLNRFGCIVEEEWRRVAQVRNEIELDEWILMPDHLHAIVCIRHNIGAKLASSPRAAKSISSLVAGFKSAATSRINEKRGQTTIVWQRSFWEHIIRDERDLNNTRRYIHENPHRWTNRTSTQRP